MKAEEQADKIMIAAAQKAAKDAAKVNITRAVQKQKPERALEDKTEKIRIEQREKAKIEASAKTGLPVPPTASQKAAVKKAKAMLKATPSGVDSAAYKKAKQMIAQQRAEDDALTTASAPVHRISAPTAAEQQAEADAIKARRDFHKLEGTKPPRLGETAYQ